MYLCQTINGKTIAPRIFRISILSKTGGSASISCSYFLHLTQNFLLVLLLPCSLLYHTGCEMGHNTTDCHISVQQGPKRSFFLFFHAACKEKHLLFYAWKEQGKRHKLLLVVFQFYLHFEVKTVYYMCLSDATRKHYGRSGVQWSQPVACQLILMHYE